MERCPCCGRYFQVFWLSTAKKDEGKTCWIRQWSFSLSNGQTATLHFEQFQHIWCIRFWFVKGLYCNEICQLLYVISMFPFISVFLICDECIFQFKFFNWPEKTGFNTNIYWTDIEKKKKKKHLWNVRASIHLIEFQRVFAVIIAIVLMFVCLSIYLFFFSKGEQV